MIEIYKACVRGSVCISDWWLLIAELFIAGVSGVSGELLTDILA